MPLTDDPLVTGSVMIPRGFVPLPGAGETTKPPIPPKEPAPEQGPAWAPSPIEQAIVGVTSAVNPLAGIMSLFDTTPTMKATMRVDNTIGSVIAKAQDTFGVSNDLIDPSYNAWNDIKGTKYEPYWTGTFLNSNNANFTAALKASIDRQEDDRRTIAASGFGGTVAGILAGVADPTLLIPGGGEVELAGKGLWTVGRGALAGSRAAAVGITAQELGLHASQDVRTAQESVMNVGTGVVLGAVLGGVVAGALSKLQQVASGEALERLQRLDQPSFDTKTVAQTAVDKLNDLNPQLNGALKVNILTPEEMKARPVNEDTGLGETVAGHYGSTINLTNQTDKHGIAEELRHMVDMLLGGNQVSKWIAQDSGMKEKVVAFLTARKAAGDLAPGARFTDEKEIAQALLDQYFRNPELLKEAVPDMATFLDQSGANKYRGVLADVVNHEGGPVQGFGDAGAAVTRQPTIEDLTISGATTRNLAAATAFSPNLRANFAESPLARQTMQELNDTSLIQNMHEQGLSLGNSVERGIATSLQETAGLAIPEHMKIFQVMKKDENIPNMTADQFEVAVGQAMRRGDEGDNSYVSQAAKMWRSKVIDPLTKQAIDEGLLPEDVSVSEADSYFSRQYNKDRLVAQRPEFIDTATNYLNNIMKDGYASGAEKLTSRLAKLDQEVKDLQLTPEERVAALSTLEEQRTALDQSMPAEAELATKINAAQGKVRAASTPEDKAVAKAEVEALKASGGQSFQDYNKALRSMTTRKRGLNFNIPGLAEKADRIQQSIDDLHETNQRNLGALVTRGKKLIKELAKMDDAKLAATISDLRTKFHALIEGSNRAQDRLAAQIEKLKNEGGGPTAKVFDNIVGPIPDKGVVPANVGKDGKIYTGTQGSTHFHVMEQHPEAGPWTGGTGFVNKEGKFLDRTEALAYVTAEGERIKSSIGDELDALDYKEQSRVKSKTRADLLEEARVKELGRMERLNALDERLQVAESLDYNASREEVKATVDQMVKEISDKTLTRGEKIAEWKAKMAKLDPAKVGARLAAVGQLKKDMERAFYDRWETGRLGEGLDIKDPSKADFTTHAKDLATDIHNRLVGNDFGSNVVDPQFRLPIAYGPLRDRTFHIPDAQIEQFLESNVVKVMTKFARTMSAQVELTRKFGDMHMAGRLAEIEKQYDILAEGAKTEKERTLLQADRQKQIRFIQATRDMHLGTYLAKENASTWGRVVSGLMKFNFIRTMGGSAIPSLSDLFGPALFHGIDRYTSVAMRPLLKNLGDVKLLRKSETKYAVLSEQWLHHRLMTTAEIGDPYARGNTVERWLDQGVKIGAHWNGLGMLTDFEKDFTAQIVQDHLNEAITKGNDTRFLAWAGIDNDMKDVIRAQLVKHGETIDGVTVANTDQWDEGSWHAVRAYRAAVGKSVDMDIVTRGVGDVPLSFLTPMGRLLTQFKTFNLAAHQRMLLRATQMGPAQFASGLIGITTIGMFATVLKAMNGGADNWKRFKDSSGITTGQYNMGYMVGEGLDQSGLFTLPIEVGNLTEKGTAEMGYAFNPAKTPFLLANKLFQPDASMQGNSQKYATTGVIDALAGPSGGLLEKGLAASGGAIDAARSKEVTMHKKRAATQLVPFSSYIGFKQALQYLINDSPAQPH